MKRAHNFKDLTGQIFGKWTVLGFDGIRVRPSGKPSSYWICRCQCGKEKSVIGAQLVYGSSRQCRSCGAHRLPRGESSRNALLAEYKRGARDRNLVWNLSESQFDLLTQSNCFYCGIAPNKIRKAETYWGEYVYNGIDRVDNLKGYESDNVVSCCKTCNRAKDIMTQEEFRSWIKKVFYHGEEIYSKGSETSRSIN